MALENYGTHLDFFIYPLVNKGMYLKKEEKWSRQPSPPHSPTPVIQLVILFVKWKGPTLIFLNLLPKFQALFIHYKL